MSDAIKTAQENLAVVVDDAGAQVIADGLPTVMGETITAKSGYPFASERVNSLPLWLDSTGAGSHAVPVRRWQDQPVFVLSRGRSWHPDIQGYSLDS